MGVSYTPVQWTRSKQFYDAILIGMVFAYVLIYLRLAPVFLDHTRPVDGAIVNARAFGTCAFLMLTAILCIGPLARLDRRFLPLLYNRRHFGVLTFLVALTHAAFVLNWYFNFSPTPSLTALLGSNTSYDQLLGFPFEALGILALLALAILAATSHDFWLNFLTPPIWKALHYLIYPAYALLVGHVGLGALQSETNPAFTIVVGFSVLAVCGLHLTAAIWEGLLSKPAKDRSDWFAAGNISDFTEGRARIAHLAGGDRVAIFLHEGKLSAISNACAHQNGPLGEGRIIDGCVTCPWHGFQYKVEDGRSPAPFTEMVPTYALKVEGNQVFVNTQANPPGTFVKPTPLPGGAS
jgi:nitrite reductase/ring-hydroxylating ferredoxin subunit/DMSO/TMAO reductase YedYZ heme-binding membrane subunit